MADDLTQKSILEYAISLEERAVQLYTDLAGRTSSDSVKEAFLEYADEERGHKAKLEGVMNGEAYINSNEKVVDLKISDYTVDVKLGDDPEYQDILLFAIEQEKRAYNLYTDLAGKVDSDELKELFLALAAEEAKHKNKFETEYDEKVLTQN